MTLEFLSPQTTDLRSSGEKYSHVTLKSPLARVRKQMRDAIGSLLVLAMGSLVLLSDSKRKRRDHGLLFQKVTHSIEANTLLRRFRVIRCSFMLQGVSGGRHCPRGWLPYKHFVSSSCWGTSWGWTSWEVERELLNSLYESASPPPSGDTEAVQSSTLSYFRQRPAYLSVCIPLYYGGVGIIIISRGRPPLNMEIIKILWIMISLGVSEFFVM